MAIKTFKSTSDKHVAKVHKSRVLRRKEKISQRGGGQFADLPPGQRQKVLKANGYTR